MADMKATGCEMAPLFLRLALAVIFLAHGGQKLALLDPDTISWQATKASIADNVVKPFEAMGLKPAEPLAWFVAVTEFGGGLALALGLLTRLAAFGLLAIMGVAVWKVHWQNGLFLPGGFEYNLMIGAACLALILMGGGAVALDRLVAKKPPQKKS